MKLNKGEKLYCKRDVFTLKKDTWYKISNIFDNGNIIFICCKGIIEFRTRPSGGHYFLTDYFYTKKEMRKMKLDEIEGIL